MGYQDNVELLNGILAALENGELTTEEETEALDLAAQLNAFTEYGYYIFSPDAVKNVQNHVDAAVEGQKYWGNNKGFVLTDTGAATASLVQKQESGDTDFTDEIAAYNAALDQQLPLLKDAINNEAAAMQGVVKLLEA